jgi:hypothetical protein
VETWYDIWSGPTGTDALKGSTGVRGQCNRHFGYRATALVKNLEPILPSKTNKKKLRGLSPQANYIPTERPPLVGDVSANFSG